MAYTKTVWSTGDTITATLFNHAETQYDEAKADIDAHTGRTDNPHGVTASQAGALPSTTYLTTDGISAKQVSGDWNDYIDTGFYRGSGLVNQPTGTGAHSWKYVMVIRHNTSYVVQHAWDFNGDYEWFRSLLNDVWQPWNMVWHAGNDGAGSTMDADMVDGKHASDFQLASDSAKIAVGSYTGDATVSRAISVGFQPIQVKVWTVHYDDYSLFIPSTTGGSRISALDVGKNTVRFEDALNAKYGKLTSTGFETGNDTLAYGNVSGIIHYWEAYG
jgi:hypothetical protein